MIVFYHFSYLSRLCVNYTPCFSEALVRTITGTFPLSSYFLECNFTNELTWLPPSKTRAYTFTSINHFSLKSTALMPRCTLRVYPRHEFPVWRTKSATPGYLHVVFGHPASPLPVLLVQTAMIGICLPNLWHYKPFISKSASEK